MPAGKIPEPLLARVNELADVLGYLEVGQHWGTGAKPADLRVGKNDLPPGADSAPAAEQADEHGQAAATLPDWAMAVDRRVKAGLARAGAEFARAHGIRAKESVLLFVSAPAWTDADAWWRLDLGAGTVAGGLGDRKVDTDWSLTGSAQAWDRLLAGESNLGVAFRRGDLRYADKGDAGAGSIGADARVATLTDLLGVPR